MFLLSVCLFSTAGLRKYYSIDLHKFGGKGPRGTRKKVSSNQCLYCYTGDKVIVAQDKTPKRGSRCPVVDNPHRSRLTRCPPHDWSSTAAARV